MVSRSIFVFALAAAAVGASFVVACSSSGIDTTKYGPPDAGKPAAVYCIRDLDCQIDGGPQICGFPIDDGCAARGVCVDLLQGVGKCDTQSTTYCGCDLGAVTSCAVQDGYVRGGPTNGNKPVDVDGSPSCN